MVVADLPLPSLSIRNFRGIPDLKIKRLGRVTLIVGDNSVGKSSLLSAVRVYAARGSLNTLIEIISDKREVTQFMDYEGQQVCLADLNALIYGRKPTPESRISISANGADAELSIQFRESYLNSRNIVDELDPLLTVEFQETHANLTLKHMLRFAEHPNIANFYADKSTDDRITCELVSSGVMDDKSIARLWDAIVLTPAEDQTVQALQLIYGNAVERAGIVGEETKGKPDGRRPIVKMANYQRPVPLRSLGEGANRLFGMALALANSQNGLLLIDEAENGLYHSRHKDLWKLIIQSALENNVQVLATTHSWDCVTGFARALTEVEEPECGSLIRLERFDDKNHAVQYTMADLQVISQQGIEVR